MIGPIMAAFIIIFVVGWISENSTNNKEKHNGKRK